jgi:chromosome partitioning protein
VDAVRVTYGNLKGGVGKSTSSVYTALILAGSGRVLLVDADATNRTCLKWSAAPDWPRQVVVMPWAVPDLARRVQDVQDDYDHILIDTGPQHDKILRQALLVTDDLVVPISPSPVEVEQLPDTFELAAEVDAISPVFAHVLLCQVRRGTRSAVEARAYLAERELPVMDAEVHMAEAYKLAYGTVPGDLGEYRQVVDELRAEDRVA